MADALAARAARNVHRSEGSGGHRSRHRRADGGPWGDVDADPVAVRLVFLAPKGGPIPRTTLNGRWAKMATRAGVPQARPHDLRHHYASVLIDGGESVKVVQERLGHASAMETLDTYSHLWPSSDERTRSVVERARIDAPAERMRNAEGQ